MSVYILSSKKVEISIINTIYKIKKNNTSDIFSCES